MTDNIQSNVRVLAAGAERIAPKPADEKKAEGPARGNWFVRRIVVPLVSGLALVASHGCADNGPENTDSDQDADTVQDVENEDGEAQEEDSVSPDAEDGVEADVPDTEPEADAEAMEDVGPETAEDSDSTEADGSCPTETTVTENPAAPGTIAGIAQTITENYDVTTECDGSETRMLAESGIVFDSPVSGDTSNRAIADGADTVMFGRIARLTMLRVGLVEFAFHVEGAAGNKRPSESVDDGAHVATVQNITDGNASLRVTDMGGTEVGIADLAAGQYYILPSGRIVMVTDIRYDSFDPLNSTCYVAFLEAPIRGVHGRTISYGPGVYAVSIDDNIFSVLGIGLVRTSP